MLGAVLIRWSIYLALSCLALRLATELRPNLFPWRFTGIRWIWSLGCLAFVVHVVSAFQYKHHWSHAAAFQVTAQRTEEMMGFRFGEGIYFSYFFTLLWLADVAWMWFSPAGYQRRSLAITGFGLGYLAFIAFNGAVVFETHLTRLVGIPVSIALAILAWQTWFAPLATVSEPGAERA